MYPKYQDDNVIFVDSKKQTYRQCLLGLLVTIDCFIGGMGFNFTSTLLPQLNEIDSDIKATEDQGTWIASVLILACLPGTIAGTFLVELIGRKWTYALVALINTTAWATKATSTSVIQLILGRGVQGFALGMSYPACYCLVGEVVMVQHRSVVLNVINIGGTCGMLFSDLMGTFQPWRTSACIIIGLSLTCFAILLYLGDTHVWHLRHNRIEQAKRAYFWYIPETADNLMEYQDVMIKSKNDNGISVRMVLNELTRKEFLLPLFILLWFTTTVVFTGGSGMALYSVKIMNQVVSIDEYVTTITIDVIRVLAAFCTIIILKYLPIRWIINGSSVLCASFLLIFCAALNWDSAWSGFQWVALFAILAFNFFYSVGYVNINNISLGELFTGITKSVGTTVAVLHLYCMNFVIAQLIPRMFDYLGSIWTFLIFATCCAIGGIGLFLFMPETRGISNEQIRANFAKLGRNKVK